MTLDGFLPDNDNVSMQWVINHKNGFPRWRERCSAFILPHSILDLLCEKDRRDDSFTYLAEIRDLESLELLRGLFHYNLVDELIVYRCRIPSVKEFPYWTFTLPGNGSCIKQPLFPTASVV